MGRHRVRYAVLGGGDTRIVYDENMKPLEPTWALLYRTEYTQMVGWRVRRLRRERDWTQQKLAKEIAHPRGDRYSPGLISRIEKGHANPPLYAYVHLAETLELDPGRLLGSYELEAEISEAERTLILFLRRGRITVDEALSRIVAGATKKRSAP